MNNFPPKDECPAKPMVLAAFSPGNIPLEDPWFYPVLDSFPLAGKRKAAWSGIGAKLFWGGILWFSFFSRSASAMQTIVPGGDWYDTSGNHIYATEGGIIKVGSLYYLWGEDRSQNNSTFIGVNLYSSPDLKNWTFVNQILSSSSNALLGGGATIERAKILYNAATGQYVMWMHYEDHNAYNVAEVAYATCNTIGGNYTFQNHFQPMGIDSRDMNVYQDTDGTAYLLCTTLGNQNVSIFKLDPTYTSVVSEVFRGAASNGMSCEGHAMIKTGGYYFWIMSLCTGWNFNDNHYFYATSLAGPWTAGGNIVPTGSHTYESQVGWALPVTGSGQTTFVYMGDRWSVSNFSMTRMVMLPIQVSGTSLKVPWYDQWDIDTQTGAWQADPQVVWNGNYKIINRHSGKLLDVLNGSTADSAVVDQYTDNGGANQQWTIKNLGGSDYQFTSVNSGKLLDISGAGTTVGSPAIQYTSNGGYNQKWHIIDSSQGAGYYRLVNDNTLEKTLEVPGGSTANGTGTALGTFNYSDYQEWQFVSTNATSTPTPGGTGTSTFTITATASMTPTASSTATPSATRTSTNSPSITATNTSSSTPTNTPTYTFSGTSTFTPTSSGTPTPTSTGTPSPTLTPTATRTFTLTPTNTVTPPLIPTATNTAIFTNTFIPTGTPTLTQTSTFTLTSTLNPSPTDTFTNTWTKTTTATHTLTLTPVNSLSPTSTATSVPTNTQSFTPISTLTPTSISTQTNSLTSTLTPTLTSTYTFTTALTHSNTFTPTNSFTPTLTVTSTYTQTPPPSFAPTATASATRTATVPSKGTSTVVVYPNPAPGDSINVLAPPYPGLSNVRVEIFTTAFRKVQDRIFTSVASGTSVTLTLVDKWGTPLASGFYYVVVTTSSGRSIGKLLVLR